ncbi:helix-turn-helix domain-containing protein [Microbacterium sp. KR10-403]|uniref:TetR/AcrR family transcriptional regulator n=1 Tax=Microbacterium sp. KR10-403 TaxID=3158581 RepID=UPI0032E44E9E
MSDASEPRRLRQDAVRNRADVLAAAERVFARRGLEATVEDIAAEAGVGVGTVYRRFGSKSELIQTLYRERLDQVLELIDHCAALPTGRQALHAVMRAFVDLQTLSRAQQQLLFSTEAPDAGVLRTEVEPRLTAIIERAKAEGAVRADFAATDVPVLTHAVTDAATRLPDGGRELAVRHLELLLKGLAPGEDEVPIPPPLPDERFAQWLQPV